MCTNNYSNKERFDKVITKIKGYNFLPRRVYGLFISHIYSYHDVVIF